MSVAGNTSSIWIPAFIPQTVYRNFARIAAARHLLDPALVCAVCEEESGMRDAINQPESWDPSAVKAEEHFFTRYIHPALPDRPTLEELLRSWSYGLMQIMGETARERGYNGRYLTGLCDAETGLEFGCRHLANRLKAANGSISEALQLWNGGSDPNYAARVIARRIKYLNVLARE